MWDCGRPGAEGIAITIGSGSAIIAFGVSWPNFQLDNRIREGLRAIAREIARSLASTFVVYIPDSGWAAAERALSSFFEGTEIQATLATLAAEIHRKGSFKTEPIDIKAAPEQHFASHDLLPDYYLIDRLEHDSV